MAKHDLYPPLGISSFILIFGIAFGVGAFLTFRRSYRKVKGWKTDSGVVIDDVTRGYGYQINYSPKIEFTTDSGTQLTFIASVASQRKSYRIDDKVKVLYSPDDPEKADLKSFSNLWLFPVFLGMFALVFLGGGLFVFINVLIDILK
jgi:hypothetical protein